MSDDNERLSESGLAAMLINLRSVAGMMAALPPEQRTINLYLPPVLAVFEELAALREAQGPLERLAIAVVENQVRKEIFWAVDEVVMQLWADPGMAAEIEPLAAWALKTLHRAEAELRAAINALPLAAIEAPERVPQAPLVALLREAAALPRYDGTEYPECIAGCGAEWSPYMSERAHRPGCIYLRMDAALAAIDAQAGVTP